MPSTLEKVRAILPKDIPLSVSSDPSMSQAQVWLDEDDSSVNVALSVGGYTYPPTDANQIASISLLIAGDVAYRVMKTRASASKDFEDSGWAKYHEEFMAALALMRESEWGPIPISSGISTVSGKTDATVWFEKDHEY
jgi:hypothetical protein